MKPKYLLILFLLVATATRAQNYEPIDARSKVHFVIKNFGIGTGGDFTGLKGAIRFLPDSISGSRFDVSVAASTVNTDNNMRDKNLVNDEYFDAAKYPLIKLVSTKITKTNKTDSGFYYFTGNLTIKGVTKTINFPFHAKKVNEGYLFTGSFDIDRTVFGVGDQSMVLSNKVSVSLSVAAQTN